MDSWGSLPVKEQVHANTSVVTFMHLSRCHMMQKPPRDGFPQVWCRLNQSNLQFHPLVSPGFCAKLSRPAAACSSVLNTERYRSSLQTPAKESHARSSLNTELFLAVIMICLRASQGFLRPPEPAPELS